MLKKIEFICGLDVSRRGTGNMADNKYLYESFSAYDNRKRSMIDMVLYYI